MEEKTNENEIKKVEQLLSSHYSKCEEDKIKELDLNCYDDYINSIFPNNFDDSFKNEIIESIKDYKNIPVMNSITIFSISKNINSNSFYSFLFGIKKNDENRVDVYYKLMNKQNVIESNINITSKYEYKENSEELKNIDLNVDNKTKVYINKVKKIGEFVENLIKDFCSFIKSQK